MQAVPGHISAFIVTLLGSGREGAEGSCGAADVALLTACEAACR